VASAQCAAPIRSASAAAAPRCAAAASRRPSTVTSGHFMAEEAPGEVTAAVRDLLAR
jgi:haloacetate dehalogenase